MKDIKKPDPLLTQPVPATDVAEEMMEKYDVESRYRKFTGSWARVVMVIAVAMSLFHYYTAGFGALTAMKQRSIHLAFLLALTFILYPATGKSSKDKPSLIDLLWLVVGVGASMYLFFYFDEFSIRGTAIPRDIFFGFLTILAVMEAARRAVGKELPILAAVFWLYALFGDRIPGIFGHTGFTFRRIVYHLYLSSEGIFGIVLGVSATYIFLFILFGAFLGETGMAEFINSFSMAVAGRSPGGPGKVAIVASGLLGTISGSAVANVATTGAFTIPLMKSVGYRPAFAGAVEAVASTGGQIMPPVMGAAAFVMAEFLGLKYSQIMLAAILPAVLYYIAVFVVVHFEALKTGLLGLPKDQLPDMKTLLRTRGHLITPLVVIIYLLMKGRTPLYAAFYGIIIAVVVSWIRPDTRLTFSGLINALEGGARGAVSTGIACAVVGNIVGITSLTGLGLVVGDNIITLAGGNIFMTFVLAMIVSIILGMGLPTTACYIVAATIAGPALIKLGVEPLQAHMFVFYFACLSNLTPPVALAAYTGAGIAGANPATVGWLAFRMALAGFIIPYIFVYSPQLLLMGGSNLEIIQACITSIIGVVGLAGFVQAYFMGNLNMVQRVILLVGALSLMIPGLITDIIGFASLGVIYLWQKGSSGQLSVGS